MRPCHRPWFRRWSGSRSWCNRRRSSRYSWKWSMPTRNTSATGTQHTPVRYHSRSCRPSGPPRSRDTYTDRSGRGSMPAGSRKGCRPTGRTTQTELPRGSSWAGWRERSHRSARSPPARPFSWGQLPRRPSQSPFRNSGGPASSCHRQS